MASPLRVFVVMQERESRARVQSHRKKAASAETGDRNCSSPSL